MLRLLLIISLVVYVLYKLGVFRIFMNTQVRGNGQPRNFNRRPYDGNVNIDAEPDAKKKKGYRGGEYVDYEDVK